MSRDAVYITILRNPGIQFESLFSYYAAGRHLGITSRDPLKDFISSPEYYYDANVVLFPLKNPFLFDMGFGADSWEYDENISEAIKLIEDTYSLVMICEYFDESLILLGRLLCWDLDDIVYFALNQRMQSSQASGITQSIHDWNRGDYLLYQHFNKTFWNKVEQFGKNKMAAEVDILRTRIRDYWSLCIMEVTVNGEGVWAENGVRIKTYKLKESAKHNSQCQRMVMPEVTYTKLLQEAQYAKIYNMKNSVL
ncbi:galactosylceramide sulfotransferase-like [Saccoglossus kowalevskii]|uniref:Galactosylceramide sulfotransferase-like n=1 Tax=Saccoglossus kowalevskii TaxID=10224 RepID=A0ABM0LW62_SACKO|nr:PREDICTED: galactosylceramide sulfotransferase-like [Saccoglossus kowalevskii]